jgi:plasmid stabilization system protein ParE
MLGAHVKFLAQKSPSIARDLKTRLLAAVRSLSAMPERFPFFDGEFIPRNKYHKMVVDSRYLLIYQIRDSTVFIEYILDGRQNYNWLVR